MIETLVLIMVSAAFGTGAAMISAKIQGLW